MSIELLIVALILFMLIGALIAVEAKDLLSSVIALGAAGFALSVIDLLVGAPDLAITQVVVEVVVLVLLIRVVVKRKDESVAVARDALRTGAVLLGAGVLLAVVFVSVSATGGLPPFGEPVLTNAPTASIPPGVGAQYLQRAVEETGAANSVSAVLLDYRAYDTLGEATVVFVSILGAYAVLRKVGRKKASESDEAVQEEPIS